MIFFANPTGAALDAIREGRPVLHGGFVMDFADVKVAVKPIIERLDHHCLNDIIDNPTVENQLVFLWEQLKLLPGLYELILRETSTNSARYRGIV